MKTKHINYLIVALSLHIFVVNSILLYTLNFDVQDKYSFFDFEKESLLAMLFAISYSIGTISVLSRSGKKQLIFFYAGLDSFGVLLNYFEAIPNPIRAVYFALYTGTLIVSTQFMDKPEYIADQITEMKQKGISQREIAQKLNISESMVSRTLKRVNDSNGSVKIKSG